LREVKKMEEKLQAPRKKMKWGGAAHRRPLAMLQQGRGASMVEGEGKLSHGQV
jgi:hypothetical protein